MCWHNVTKDKDSLKDELSGNSDLEKPRSTPLIQHIHDKSCPFRRLALSKRLREDASMKGEKVSDGRVAEVSESSCTSGEQVACSSGFDGEKLSSFDNCDDSNACSVSSLPLELSRSEKGFREIENGYGPSSHNVDNTSGNSSLEPSMAKMGSFRGSLRNRSSIRSIQSYMHFGRPLSSFESCLLSQLYNEQTKMEEYVISSLQSTYSAPTIRPFLVSDGSQILSRASENSFNAWIETDRDIKPKETLVEQAENVFGIPSLPKAMSMELPNEIKLKTGKVLSQRLSIPSKTVNGRYSHSQGDEKLLLSLGISIGIISSVISNKREVETLRDLLKQTENLVQDLQEEIEMKDAITVKELVNEGYYDSLDACECSFHNMEPNALTPAQDLKKLARNGSEELYERTIDKNSEHMRTIEAELEAELERLELSINVEGVPDLVESDPEYVAHVVRGELRTDNVTEGAGARTDSGQCTSSTSTTHSANYAVSPRELSLRLHEVIQSRLEERVRELEVALRNSQRKVRDSESKQMYSWRELSDSDSESGSSPNHEDQITTEEYGSNAQPLVLNISEKFISAFHDSIEEVEDAHLFSFNSSLRDHTVDEGIPEELSTVKEWGSNDFDMSSDDENDDGDEMENLLIKQIVARTKQGSPALLNAQRALFSMVENEHPKE